MKFNPSKCSHLIISNKHHILHYNYHLCDQPIQRVSQAKYLGVTFDEHLNWKHHIASICNKANAAKSFLKRNVNYCPTNFKANCYKSFVRPILEYASTVWSPHLQCDIQQLDKIQRSYVFNDYSWNSSVTNMLSNLKWPTLDQRRTYNKLVMFFKLVEGIIEIPTLQLTPHSHQSPRDTTNDTEFHKPELTYSYTPFYHQQSNFGTIYPII